MQSRSDSPISWGPQPVVKGRDWCLNTNAIFSAGEGCRKSVHELFTRETAGVAADAAGFGRNA